MAHENRIPISLIIRGGIGLTSLFIIYLIIRQFAISEPSRIHTESQVVVQEVVALGRLELVKFQMRDVVAKQIENRYWFDTKVLLVIAGEVIGCVDLHKLKPEQMVVVGDSVSIRLPEPEICVVKVDHQSTKIYNAEFTLIDYIHDRHAEILSATFREAEGQIRAAAIQQGIMEETRQNAEKFFVPFFKGLGFRAVGVRFAAPAQ